MKTLIVAMLSMLVLASAPNMLAAPATAPAAKALRTEDSAVTPTARTEKWWVRQHEGYLRTVAAHKDAQVIFVGDSITDNWQNVPSFKADYGKYDAIDLGVGGDRTEQVLWRLNNGEIDGLHPKVAVLLVGTNNLFQHDKPEWVAAGVQTIVDTLHQKLPQTTVLLLGIFPRDVPTDSSRAIIKDINQRLAKLDGRRTKYLDIGDVFLNSKGEISKDVMADLLHPTPKGYDLWAKAMQPTLDALMGRAAN